MSKGISKFAAQAKRKFIPYKPPARPFQRKTIDAPACTVRSPSDNITLSLPK